MRYIYHFHQTPRELERTAWASWLKAGRTPGHYRPYFWRIKKNAVDPRRAGVFPLFVSPYPFNICFDRSPTAWGTVGERTAMLNCFPHSSPSRFIPLCRYQSVPLPCRRVCFFRFEQEEVGRWSRQKRQACGPLTTSCSLFCDTKTVQRSVLRAALSLVRHSRRRNPVFQVWNAPVNSLSKGTEMLIVYSCVNFCRSHAWVAFNMFLTGSVISLLSMPQIYKSTGVWRLTGSGFKIQLKRKAVLSSAILRKNTTCIGSTVAE